MIKYNEPIQLKSLATYHKLMNHFSGIICGRIDENGRPFIKCWFMKYAPYVEKAINQLEQ
jgi:hypothetical protein